MAAQLADNFRPRRSFGKIRRVVDIPNLIAIQRRSYDDFLQLDVQLEVGGDVAAARPSM